MPDESATPPPQPAADNTPAPESTTDDNLGDAGKKALDVEREARKASDDRAKALERELNTLRKSSMSEADKAVAEARVAGRTEAVTEFGKRLARSEFDAAASRRNPDFDSVSALEWVDLSLFVGEDGEPNTKAIKAAVERLVPAPADGPPSFDGGARTSAPASAGMNGLIRKAAGRA